MANLPTFLSATKNLSEEYNEAINSATASASDNRRSPSRNCWTRTLYTSHWQIHDIIVHEVSLATVAGLGGDVIARNWRWKNWTVDSRQLNQSSTLHFGKMFISIFWISNTKSGYW